MYVKCSEPLQERLNRGLFRVKKQLFVNKNRGYLEEGTIVSIVLTHDYFDYDDWKSYELKIGVVEKGFYPRLYKTSSFVYAKFKDFSEDGNDFSWFDEWFEPAEKCNEIMQRYDAVRESLEKRQEKVTYTIGGVGFVVGTVLGSVLGIPLLSDDTAIDFIANILCVAVVMFCIMVIVVTCALVVYDRIIKSNFTKFEEEFSALLT